MLEPMRPYSLDASSGMHAKRTVDSVPGLGELPDLLLVERTRGRDTRAFETLMRRYNRRLFRIARSILNDDEQAEEAVRSAHIRAFSNLDRYEPAGKFGSWLARLSFHEAQALRRQSGPPDRGAGPGETGSSATRGIAAGAVPAAHGSSTLGSPPDGAGEHGTDSGSGKEPASAGDSDESAANRRLLETAIDGLPEVFRTVLVLRVIEELSGVEVAVCLGLNETTVRTRLYRAQQRLKELAARLRAEPSNIFDLSQERGDRIVTQVMARVHNVTQPTDIR